MPILWRFLLKTFLKIFFFTVAAFVAILLTMRLDEIAHFAGLGAPLYQLLTFTFYQLPYILPIAFPLAGLISAFILFQRLSKTYELTAMRACGISLNDALAPILITVLFLSVANFWITSEFATDCHLRANKLKSELRAINPLLLLNNRHLMRLKGYYYQAANSARAGEAAEDVILALPNQHRGRIFLMVAKKLNVTPTSFNGEDSTLIATVPSENQEDFDHLLIENMGRSYTETTHFTDLFQHKVWTINNDYLRLPFLLERIAELKDSLEGKMLVDDIKQQRKNLDKAKSEIVKRVSIALAVFSLTLMGGICAVNISRRKPLFPYCLAVGLTTFYLVAFFVARSVEQQFWLAFCLYLVPHLVIILFSLFLLRRINRGVETW